MILFICLIGLYVCTGLSDGPMYVYFFSILFPLGPIHPPDSLEEVMTLVHQLEAHTSYAYGGYLAGAEASHFLRNESCTQLGFYNLLPSCFWYALSLPHDLGLRRFGC